MVKVEVRIELKHGVADPEGDNTRKALEMLGFAGVRSVRTIKVFEMDLDAGEAEARKAAEEMSRRLLANPVIQTYSVKVK